MRREKIIYKVVEFPYTVTSTWGIVVHVLRPRMWQLDKVSTLDPWVRKIPWRRKWQPASEFLPAESHGQRSLAGYSPQGGKEVDMTKAT